MTRTFYRRQLYSTGITSFGKALENLPSVSHIRIGVNQLTAVPSLKGLTALEILYDRVPHHLRRALSGTPLTHAPVTCTATRSSG